MCSLHCFTGRPLKQLRWKVARSMVTCVVCRTKLYPKRFFGSLAKEFGFHMKKREKAVFSVAENTVQYQLL